MMETEGTDLSAAIAEALERQQATDPTGGAPAAPGVPATPGPSPVAGAPAGGATPGAALGTPVETPAAATPGPGPAAPGAPLNAPAAGDGDMAQRPHFELLIAEAEPDNSGLKRALIVAVVLLVIVVAAVVLLYLGQEGVLSY